MNRIARTLHVPWLLLATVIVTLVVYDSVGARSSQQRPTTAATVNLAKVLDGLDQRADAEIRLTSLSQQNKAELAQREAEIMKVKDQLDATTDPVERNALEEQIALDTLQAQAWMQFKAEEQDVELALLFQDLYRSIKLSIAETAETEGFDLVIVDDSQGELGFNPDARISRDAQVKQQIRGRRLLYANSSIDITDDLVARMNNKYRMTGP